MILDHLHSAAATIAAIWAFRARFRANPAANLAYEQVVAQFLPLARRWRLIARRMIILRSASSSLIVVYFLSNLSLITASRCFSTLFTTCIQGAGTLPECTFLPVIG